MAELTIFLAVILALVVKDGVFACSLRSHKDKFGSSLCSDLTTTPHHILVPKPHKTSLCDSTSKSSTSNSNVSPGLPNVSTSPFKPIHNSGTPLSDPTSVLPSSPVSSVFYQAVLNNLIQSLLSLPTTNTSSASKIVPSSPTTNTATISGQINTLSPCASSTNSNVHSPTVLSSSPCSSVPPSGVSTIPGQVLKAHIISSPCASTITPSVLSGSPCDLNASSTVNTSTSHGLQLLPTFPTLTSGFNFTNLINKLSSLVLKPTSLPTPKLLPPSPPCPMFTPVTLNKHGVPEPVVKLNNVSFPRKPSLGASSCFTNALPGLRHEQSSSAKITVPTAVLVLTSEANPEPAPEEFPKILSVPKPTSNRSNFSGHYPTVINFLHKLLFPHQTPNVSTVSPPPTLPPLFTFTTSTLNITPTAQPSVLKPHTSSTPCATSTSLSSSNDFSSPTKLNQEPLTPLFISVPTSGISSGYNPDYMKLLIKYLLSTPTSLPPQLSSSHMPSQSQSNLTSESSSTTNLLSTSTSNGTISELNSTVSDVTNSNKSFNSAPASVIIPNTSCTSSYGSLSYIICKLEGLGYSSNLSSDLSNSISATTTDQNKNKNIETLTPTPCSPLSGLDKCRLKLSRLPKLPTSSSGVDSLSHKILQPHTTPILSPCLSHSKLNSNCKH